MGHHVSFCHYRCRPNDFVTNVQFYGKNNVLQYPTVNTLSVVRMSLSRDLMYLGVSPGHSMTNIFY